MSKYEYYCTKISFKKLWIFKRGVGNKCWIFYCVTFLSIMIIWMTSSIWSIINKLFDVKSDNIMRGTELLFVALLLILWHIIVWQSNAQLTLHLLPQLLASLLQPLKIWLIWRLKQLRWFIKIPFFRASVSSSRASFSSIIFSVILFLFSSTASLSVVTFALSWSTSVWSLI